MAPATHDPGGSPTSAPPAWAIFTLLTLDVLLMAFSIVLWQLDNAGLAATAGAGAIALTVEIARRLLAPGALPGTLPGAAAGPAPSEPSPMPVVPAGGAAVTAAADPVLPGGTERAA